MAELEKLELNDVLKDEIVDEVHRVRREIFEEAGGTIEGYLEHVRKLAKQAPNPRWEPQHDR